MSDLRYQQAAYNNAVWCNSVCRAHGNPGEFHEGIWISHHPTPLYYPNAVTTAPKSQMQLEHIRALDAAGLGNEWAVKDSFAELELASFGYGLLFDASWIYLSPSVRLADSAVSDVQWKPLASASALKEWEAGWWGESPASTRQFPDSLLEDADVTFLAAYKEDGHIIAGAIANRSEDVVGLSNFFVPSSDTKNYWPGCAAAIRTLFPDLPIVGYERDEELQLAHQAGFESVGPLRVWLKKP